MQVTELFYTNRSAIKRLLKENDLLNQERDSINEYLNYIHEDPKIIVKTYGTALFSFCETDGMDRRIYHSPSMAISATSITKLMEYSINCNDKNNPIYHIDPAISRKFYLKVSSLISNRFVKDLIELNTDFYIQETITLNNWLLISSKPYSSLIVFYSPELSNLAYKIFEGIPMHPTNETTTIPTSAEENKKENIMNINTTAMKFDFGPCGEGIALSPYGIAIKSADGWLTYNPETSQTINVNDVVFHMKGMIYKIPVAVKDVHTGDLILHQNKAMYVTDVENGAIDAVDILDSEVKTIIPVTNMFGFNFTV